MAFVVSNIYTLDVHSPKKATVLTNGILPAPAAGVVSIHIGSTVDVNRVQSIVGTLVKCHDMVQTELNGALSVKAHAVVGEKATLDGTPGTDEVTLSIGTTMVTNGQSHYVDRTFKRLIEYILEDAK